MPNQKVLIIGAGIGGIASGIYLSRAGFDVTIVEKNPFPGGRCANIMHEGHRFDLGATLMMMPDVYEELFRFAGRDMHEELELIRMDPVYRIKYEGDQQLLFTSDLMRMREQLESIEPGSYAGFLRYMDESYRAYMLSMKHIIDRNYYRVTDFINFRNLLLLGKLKAFQDHYKRASRFFKTEHLRTAFSFQNIYVGQNPLRASAIFSMLPFMELTDGVWFPKGGMNRIIESMMKIAREQGVKFLFQSPVEKIMIRNNRADGVLMRDGSSIPADLVVCNADIPYSYDSLLPDQGKAKKVNKMKHTCSAYVFHWGVDTVLPGLEQHNVFVSGEYSANIEQVFNGKELDTEPSFYVHSPVRNDLTAAPPGQDSLTVIVPVSHIQDGENADYKSNRLRIREAVLSRLAREGLKDLPHHIKFEKCYSPLIWKSVFNLSRGATFGSLNHNIFQMGYFRPHNRHNKYKNLFFTGGSTHPGNGVPLAMISGKLVAEKITRSF